MAILKILSKSFLEATHISRFLPFFILYLTLFVAIAVFSVPVLKILPSILSFQLSTKEMTTLAISAATILIVSVIISLTNIWFVGALVNNIQTGENFKKSLKRSSSVYWQLLAFDLITIVLSFFAFMRFFGFALKTIFDILFFVSLPSIIKNGSFLEGMKTGFNLVKKKLVETGLVWFLTNIVNTVLFFGLFFLISLIFSPMLAELFSTNYDLNTFTNFSTQQYVQIVGFVLENYYYVMISAVVASLFLSVLMVFYYTVESYWFLYLSKKRL